MRFGSEEGSNSTAARGRVAWRAALVVAMLAVALPCLGTGPPRLVESDAATAPVTAATLATAAAAHPPPIEAAAGAVYDDTTGQLVYDKDAHRSYAPASMTKMMTAVVALEHGNVDAVIASDVDAATMAGDSVMGLHPGERLSLRDLLYGLLVPSGDDAALAIARGVAGSDAAFVALMNQKAAALGLTDTHFVNPHGLDAEGHVSSPADEIAIGRYAMRYPLFARIVQTKQVTITGKWVYKLTNTNVLLTERNDVIGIKTGTTDNALHAITALAVRNGHRVYVTVMRSPDYAPDVSALLDYFYGHDAWVTLDLDQPAFADPFLAADGLRVEGPTEIYIPNWQIADARVDLDLTPDAPVSALANPDLPGSNRGSATFEVAGAPVARLGVTGR